MKVEEESVMRRPMLVLAAVFIAGAVAVAPAAGAPAQTPKRGGTLVFAQPLPEPACLNILLPQCAGAGGIQLITAWRLVLEAPFDLGGDLTWRPALVSSATFTTRPPYTLTYRIRPEARWSDGTPVTARDFVFTHAAILRHIHDGPLNTLHAAVRSVRAVGPKTVRVTLLSRVGEWRRLFGGIFPAHALEGENLAEVWRDRIDNPRTGRPIGSGPFLVERWDRGRQLVLVRNPRYWGAHRSYVDRLVLRFGVQGNLPALLRSGQVHVAYNFSASFVRELHRDADLELVSGASTAWERLDFRIGPGGNPLLRKKLVRRAIAYGIDRAAIVSRLSAESGLRFVPSQSALLLTQSPHYRPVWKDYSYRPAESHRLLEQAGCMRGGDGIYACDGVRLSLRFFTHVGPGSIRPGVVEQLQVQLERVGVEVVPTFAPSNVVFGPGGVYARGEFDAALVAFIRVSQADGTKSLFGCGGAQNLTGYCQRLVTSDLDQAEDIFDAGRQAVALNRADARMAKDVPVVPLFQHPAYAVLAPGVRGFVFNSTTGVAGANNWWLAD